MNRPAGPRSASPWFAFLLLAWTCCAPVLAQSTVPPDTCTGLSLIDPKAVVRVLIPSTDLGTAWAHPGFDDKNWLRGVIGVGYEVGSSPYQDGLILYHTMDKADIADKTVKDVSGPTLHPGTMSIVPPNVVGRVGQGLAYKNDSTQFTRVAHHAELDPGTGAFSVALWFKPERAANATVGSPYTEALVAKFALPGTSGQTGGGWSIYRTQNGTFVQTISGLGTRTVSLGTSAAGQWNHAVLVVNRSTSQVIGFLNGKRIGVAALAQVTENIASSVDLHEGRDPAGNFPFTGALDDLAIWNRALTDNQVQELYSVGQAGKSLLDGSAFPAAGKMYTGLIGMDVLTKMKGFSSTAYIRLPFNLASIPATASSLTLRIKYNDGFVAYLNGAEVARRNAPTLLDDLSSAETDRPDTAALTAEAIDLSPYLGLLKPGGNVLAFHALTATPDAARFLLLPTQLCLGLDQSTTPSGDCIKTTNGRDFWIAFPENYVQEADTPLRLSVCITGSPQTQGVLDIPGLSLPGFPKPFVLPASGAITIPLPSKAELSGAESIEPKGVHVVASADVAVYGTTRMDFTTDTFLALPTKCLGLEYFVATYRNVFDGIPLLNGTQFALVAVANNTEITITPVQAVGVHPVAQPFLVKLNRGETFQLRNEFGKPADLTGTRIVANKPIGVFGSHRCANVESVNQFFCDTLVEQLLPVSSWGVTHFVVPLATRASDTVRILSASDDNLVTLATTGGSQSFNLARGEYRDVTMKVATRVNSRGPVTVMQLSNSSDTDHVTAADPFMSLVQPAVSWLDRYRFCTPPKADFEGNFINLVAPSASALELITINGVVLSGWDPARITKGAFPGNLAYAQVRLEPATVYTVLGREPIGLSAYGYSEFDSYGYPGGMRFADHSPPILNCPKEIRMNCQTVPGIAGTAGCVAVAPDLTTQVEAFDDCTSGGRIIVTQNPKPGETRPPGTYAITISAVDAKGNKSECVTAWIVEPKWTDQNFGPNIASNPSLEATVWGANADPDQDGLPNSMEQSMGSNPNLKNPLAGLVDFGTQSDGFGTFPVVFLPQSVAGDGPILELEGLGTLDGSAAWEAGPDIFESLPEADVPLAGGRHVRRAFKVRQSGNGSGPNAFFVRVRVKP